MSWHSEYSISNYALHRTHPHCARLRRCLRREEGHGNHQEYLPAQARVHDCLSLHAAIRIIRRECRAVANSSLTVAPGPREERQASIGVRAAERR